MCEFCVVIVEKYCAGAESLEEQLCGSIIENSNDRVVEEKLWSISFTVRAEQNVKKVISTLRFARSKTNENDSLPDKSRNQTS